MGLRVGFVRRGGRKARKQMFASTGGIVDIGYEIHPVQRPTPQAPLHQSWQPAEHGDSDADAIAAI